MIMIVIAGNDGNYITFFLVAMVGVTLPCQQYMIVCK